MRPPFLAYCVSLAALLLALTARVLIDPYLGSYQALVTIYAAVAIAVWAGGWRTAALVAAVGYAACHLMFLEPRGVLDFSEGRTIAGLLAYLVTCGVIVAIGEAMRAAQRRAGKLVRLVESSTDFIGMCDLNFVPFYVNPAGLKMVGLESLEQARTALVKDFFVPEDQDRVIHEFFPAVRERGYGEIELRFRHFGSGETRWMAYKVIVLADEHGKPAAYGTVSHDITERRRMEGELRTLAATLSDVDRRKNEFIATLAHELRNPLAPLRSMLDLLKRAGGDASILPKAVDTMDRQLNQLIRLADDLLDLGRITHDRLELRKEPVELGAIIRQALQMCAPYAEQAGHTVKVVLPTKPVHLHADGARLTQVFANLINNACKYTPPGGVISIAAERDEGDVLVTVEDNGSGIPPDRLEAVFGMFERLDRGLEKAHGGLGLGLPLVRRLVQQHGGMVQAKSAGPGLGSRFIVRLPAAEPASAAALPAPEFATEPTPRRRVLVVDDNRDAAAALALLLKIGGHEVHVAHDGEEGLAAAEQHRPHLILLDIGLPGLNGYEVCRMIRESAWGKRIKLAALTGWGQDDDKSKARESGFDAHLVKPATIASIEALLSDSG